MSVSAARPVSLSQLPDDVVSLSMGYLSLRDAAACRSVSQRMNRAARDALLSVVAQRDTQLGHLAEGGFRIEALRLKGVVTDAGVSALNLTDLRSLDIANNYQLTAASIPFVLRATQLTRLVTGIGEFIDETAFRIFCEELPLLANLQVKYSTVTEVALQSLPSRLTRLAFQNCSLTDTAIQHLARLSLLRDLDLSGNLELTGATFHHLARLPLRSLNFFAHSDEAFRHLAGLPLTSLEVGSCYRLTGSGLSYLADSSQLRSLKLIGLQLQDPAFFAPLKRLPLQGLNLCGSMVTDEALGHLTELPLTDLDLSACDGLTSYGLCRLLPSLSNLRSLNLSTLHFGGRTFLRLLGNLPLRKLYLANFGLKDTDLQYLENRHLQNFCISMNEQITDRVFRYLAKLPTIQCLEIVDTCVTVGRMARALRKSSFLPKLESIEFWNDRVGSQQAKEQLQSIRPVLKVNLRDSKP